MPASKDTATGAAASPPAEGHRRKLAERRFWYGVAAGGLTALIWGGQAVVARRSVLDGLTATDVTVLRFAVAGLVLLPVALRQRPFAVGKLGWARGLVLATLAGAPYSLVIVGGVAFLPALQSAVVIFGVIPIAAAALGYGVLGHPLSVGKIACLALIVVGLAVFAWTTLSTTGPEAWPGYVLFVIAGTMWGGFTTLSKLWGVDAGDATVTTAVLSLFSVPIWLVLLPVRLGVASSGAIALQAIYMGLLVGVASTYLYIRAVALLGPVRAATFTALVPIITSVLSIAILGEHPSALELVGMAVVIVAVVFSLRLDRPQA
jgi:drug/metabolite transporter (DMT)-like permease